MALADILERISADAKAEAEAILLDAEERADALLSAARTAAAAREREIRAQGASRDEADAGRVLAAARLRARDADVAARRELVERVLREAVEALTSDDARYEGFIARAVVHAARGGERVLIAAADRERLAGLPEAVRRAATDSGRSLDLDFADEPAPALRGVVLAGDRVRVEISAEATLAARREALTMLAAQMLFGQEA